MQLNTVGAQPIGEGFYINANNTPTGHLRVRVYRVTEMQIEKFNLTIELNKCGEYGIVIDSRTPYLYNPSKIKDLLRGKISFNTLENTEVNFSRVIKGRLIDSKYSGRVGVRKKNRD